MAKKKTRAASVAAVADAGIGDANDVDAASAAAAPPSDAHQIDHLRALNKMLAKQALENREHVSQLESQIHGLADEHAFVSGVESGVLGVVVSHRLDELRDSSAVEVERSISAIGGKCRDLEETVRVVKERLGLVCEERDEVKGSLDLVLRERDLAVEDLLRLKRRFEAERDAAEKELCRLKDEIGLLDNEKGAAEERAREMGVALKRMEDRLASLEHEKCEVESVLARVVAEKDTAKSEFELATAALLKAQGEAETLRGRVESLEEEKVVIQLELEKQKQGFLEEIEELTGRIHLIESEKSKVAGEKAGLEIEIARLKEKVTELETVLPVKVSLEKELEKMKESLFETERQLKSVLQEKHDIGHALKDALFKLEDKQNELVEKNKEYETVKVGFGKLEIAHGFLVEENNRLSQLLKSQKEESTKEFDDLVKKIKRIEQEKDSLDELKIEHEVVIANLKANIEKLLKEISDLEFLYKTNSKKNTQLLAGLESAEKDIDFYKKEASELKVQLLELTEYKNTADEEFRKIKAAYESLGKDHENGKKQYDSLTLEKSSLEKNLEIAQSALKEAEQKMSTTDENFKKVLFLLSNTSITILGLLEGKENCTEENSSRELEIDKVTLKIENTLEVVKGHVEKTSDLKRELDLSQITIENHKKNNNGIWKWLYPAATSLIAAISLAYATKLRGV